MLVLTRKTNESIMVGDEIEIVVIAIHGEQVKIGVKAPRSVPVHRREVFEAIQQENIEAAKQKTDSLSQAAQLFKKNKDT
jgi:carbon storage regulator